MLFKDPNILKPITHRTVLYPYNVNLPLTWNCLTREPTLVYHVSYEMYHLMIDNN